MNDDAAKVDDIFIPGDVSVGMTFRPTGTYGFKEGKLYRLFQALREGKVFPQQEWRPVKLIGQISPTAVICDE